MQYYITQTFIKKLFKKGTAIDYCAKKEYFTSLTRQLDIKESENMLLGKYFETKALGSSIHGELTEDLDRKRETKALREINEYRIREGLPIFEPPKRAKHKRIDYQVQVFRQIQAKHGFILNEHNTQIELTHKLSEREIGCSFKNEYYLKGTLDIFPVRLKLKTEEVLAIIDIKLTSNINDTWGDYCYGAPKNLDPIQGVMYLYLSQFLDENTHISEAFDSDLLDLLYKHGGMPRFYFWVFDYKPTPEAKPIEMKMDIKKRTDFIECIRKTISTIEHDEEMGWPVNPCFEFCKNCPLNPLIGNSKGIICDEYSEIESF